MNRRSWVAALVVSAVAAAAPLAAQDLSGSWELSVETPRGSQTSTLTLVQKDTVLTGTVTLAGGPRGGGARTVDISNGSVHGSAFTFTVELSFGDNSFTQTYTGTLDGSTLQGTVEGGRGGGRSFTGKRTAS